MYNSMVSFVVCMVKPWQPFKHGLRLTDYGVAGPSTEETSSETLTARRSSQASTDHNQPVHFVLAGVLPLGPRCPPAAADQIWNMSSYYRYKYPSLQRAHRPTFSVVHVLSVCWYYAHTKIYIRLQKYYVLEVR